jgi:predicted site-specific integrase-resolvase
MGKNGKKEKRFLSIGDAESFTGLGQGRLRDFYKEGILKGYTTPSGQRRFDIEHLREFCNLAPKSQDKEIKKVNYLYARVSSKKQSDDLSRQVTFLREWARDKTSQYVIIEDIGSGINFKRKGLNDILDRSLQGLIGEVVVAHKDRLSRFGFDLIETIVNKAGGSITVINDTGNTSSEQELAEDLLSIVHIYSCRQMGKRSYQKRSISSNENTNDQDQTDSGTTTES